MTALVAVVGLAILLTYGYLYPLVTVTVLLALRTLLDGWVAANGLTAVSAALSGAMLLVMLLRTVRRADRVQVFPRAWWPLVLVLVMGMIMAWQYSRLDGTTAQELLLWLLLGLFAATGESCTATSARLVATAAMFPAAVLMLVPGQTFLEGTYEGRNSGTFAHPNTAVVVFSVMAIVWIAESMRSPSALALAMSLAFVGAAVQTQSLGGLAGLVAGVAYLTWKRFGLKSAAAFAAGAFILSAYGAQWFPSIFDRLEEIRANASIAYAGATAGSNSLSWRFYNWSLYVPYIKEHFFFGNGLGSTLKDIQPAGTLVHNDPLRVLVEVGAVGLLVAAWLLVRLWRDLGRAAPIVPRATAAQAMLVTLAVHSAAANVLQTWLALDITALLIGAILAESSRRRLGSGDHPPVRSRAEGRGRSQHLPA